LIHSVLLLLLSPGGEPVQWAQLTIEQRVIIRVPMARPPKAQPRTPPRRNDDWEEKKGPRCIALRSIRAAAIVVENGIDLILEDKHRYRARLEKGCVSTGFYSGFYVEPDDDGSLCSGRDQLQARSGMSCAIDNFRRLVAAEPDD
jgi:hypothetical protein